MGQNCLELRILLFKRQCLWASAAVSNLYRLKASILSGRRNDALLKSLRVCMFSVFEPFSPRFCRFWACSAAVACSDQASLRFTNSSQPVNLVTRCQEFAEHRIELILCSKTTHILTAGFAGWI